MVRRVLIPLMLALVFLGCKEGDLCIKIRYDQVQDLKEGDGHAGSVVSLNAIVRHLINLFYF